MSLRLIFLVCSLYGIFSGNVLGQNSRSGKVDFHRADSISSLYPGYSLDNLHELSRKLTSSLPTEEEKFRAIFVWVCQNITYHTGLYEQHRRRIRKLEDQPGKLTEWEQDFNRRVFLNLRRSHSTICTGYAYLIRELALSSGINCIIVDGYGRNALSNIGTPGRANHSWNAVELNGKWYLCDPTWSSGVVDTRTGLFIPDFDDAYYLPDPEIFVRSHYPLDTRWTLLKKFPSLQEFLDGPLVYKDTSRMGILPDSPATFDITAKKGERCSFQFAADQNLLAEKMTIIIPRHGTRDDTSLQLGRNGNYVTRYTFKHKGTYAVHLLLKDSYILTYRVKVTAE